MPTISTCGSLGRRTEFTYEGNIDNGVVLKFASGDTKISSELLKAAIDHFRGKDVRGGFSMTDPTPGGFGEWVQNKSKILNKTSLTPRHGSFIAAILQNEGYLKSALDGNAVILKFTALKNNMDIQEIIQQKVMEDSLKQELEQTLSSRVQRYLKVKPHGIVPYTQFAPVSAECALLFRDGHFYGCIALSQAVAEAIVRFLCQKNGWKPKKNFEENIARLQTRQFISNEIKDKFLRIWEKRDDYHHLNPKIETDRVKLEAFAYEKVLLLKEIESEIFRFSVVDGKLVPKNRKYWILQQNGTIPIFLRLE